MSTIRSSEEWLTIIQQCRESGLSDKNWCQLNGISISAFYYNVRKLRRLSCEIPDRDNKLQPYTVQEVVPLVITGDPITEELPTLQNTSCTTTERLSFRIECDGISVICPESISSATLCSVINALRKKC